MTEEHFWSFEFRLTDRRDCGADRRFEEGLKLLLSNAIGACSLEHGIKCDHDGC